MYISKFVGMRIYEIVYHTIPVPPVIFFLNVALTHPSSVADPNTKDFLLNPNPNKNTDSDMNSDSSIVF
jgi:hypothetical protein